MSNTDKDLIESMQHYATRLDKEQYRCQADLAMVMHSEQLSAPREDRDPEIYKEFFKYGAKLAERFPNWSVMGYMTCSQGYGSDASGNITGGYGAKVERHPFVKAAKMAPVEFKEFAIASLANAYDHSRFLENLLIKNKDVFGLKIGELSDILHHSLENRAKNWNRDRNKDQLARDTFYKLMSGGNEELLSDFVTKYPQDFEKVAKTAAKGGNDALLAMVYHSKNSNSRIFQNWIEQNPKAYGEIVEIATQSVCQLQPAHKQKNAFDSAMRCVDKNFLERNPDFVVKTEQKIQQSLLQKQHNKWDGR